MKHYFGYKTNGELYSTEVLNGGFTNEINFTGSCSHEIITKIKDRRFAAGVSGFAEYDCPCPSSVGVCPCPANKFNSSYIEDGELVQRYDYNVFIDGENVNNNETIIKAPGSSIEIQLANCDAPNGFEATIKCMGGFSVLAEDPVTVTFINDDTAVVNAVAPAQGITAMVVVSGNNKLLAKQFKIKGFTV